VVTVALATAPVTGAARSFPSSDAALRAIRTLLDTGQPVAAYEAATHALSNFPRNRQLLQSLGLALARLHAFERANALLLDLYRSGSRDAETAGILARTFKDLWEIAPPGRRRRHLLRQAFYYYASGFRTASRRRDLDGAIYTGINAATTCCLLGGRAAARRRALTVGRLCERRLRRGPDYWAAASLGEAALILGDLDGAAARYREASALAAGEVQRRASTRHNARLLLRAMRLPANTLDSCFTVPSVLLVRDEYGRVVRDRTQSTRVKQTTGARETAGIAYLQINSAEGLRRAEQLLAMHADVTVILPLTPEALITCGHPIWSDPRLRRRARRVVNRAHRVVIAHERASGLSPTTLRYADGLQRGLAMLHAQRLETAVEQEWIGMSSRRRPSLNPVPPSGFHEEVKALLFADVHHYSQLNESQIPTFVREFMGTVADTLGVGRLAPDIRYTWGDALYFVFPSAEAAARCALQLQDALLGKRWARLGLPADLSLRIALHAGPALRCLDPVQRERNYVGSHVSWAARIEPVTPSGHVYASEPFAALASIERSSIVTCEYVGATILAKGYGTYPLYRVRWRDQTARRADATDRAGS
jgi:class 3 adenylate cyclase